MGGATRFLMLLTSTASPPVLHLRYPALLRLSRRRSLVSCLYHSLPSSSSPSLPRPYKIKASNEFHSQAASTPFIDPNSSSSSAVLVSQTWPEWSNFINNLYAAGYYNSQRSRINLNEEFVGGLNLPDHFVADSSACLAFAFERPDLLGILPRTDIEVVVEKGMPFLFRNGDDSIRRMRSFLGTAYSNNTDRAQTIDIVRYLLSYASNPFSSEKYMTSNREVVELSVRNLLNQLVQLSYAPDTNLSGPLQNQYPDRYGQTQISPRPSGQSVEMKRGDWVCPRCSFMNFARNMKCLECQEARPKRQLTGGEWECPQCDFFNYGRNTVCLRCDCRRPGDVSFGTDNSTSSVDSRLAANEEKAQRWFSKMSQLDRNSDISSAIADEDFPEIMPLRKGVNRFVVSTRKTPLERRQANSQRNSNFNPSLSLDQSLRNNNEPSENRQSFKGPEPPLTNQKEEEQAEKSERWFKRVAEVHNVTDLANDEDFPEIMPMRKGENQFVVSKRKDRSLTSPVYNKQASDTNFVPFVPFPPDYFARKDNQEPPKVGSSNNATSNSAIKENPQPLDDSKSAVSSNQSSWSGRSLEGSAVKEADPLDMSEEAKAERWFKRVAQIKDISELSEIPDEDFPSIMPMRKGVNRFVVSKRKTPLERRLISTQYKRNLPVTSSDPVKDNDSN